MVRRCTTANQTLLSYIPYIALTAYLANFEGENGLLYYIRNTSVQHFIMPSENVPPRIVLSHSTQDTNIRRRDLDEDRDENININDTSDYHAHVDGDNESIDSLSSPSDLHLIPEIPTGLAPIRTVQTVNDPFNDDVHLSDSSFNKSSLSNSNSPPPRNKIRNKDTEAHKRLSIFSSDSNDSIEEVKDHIIDTFVHLSTRSKKESKKSPMRNRKKLKLHIPNVDDNLKNNELGVSPQSTSRVSPMPKTPAIMKKDTMEDDLNSVLDDALFNSAWMPNIDAKNKAANDNVNILMLPNHSKSSYSSNNSSATNLRLRNKNRYSSDSFTHDLEASTSIPLANLNLSTSKLQVDNYLNPSFTTKDVAQTTFLSVPTDNHYQLPHLQQVDSSHSSIQRGYYEIGANHSTTSVNTSQLKPNNEENNVTSKASNVTKMFAKISDLVNADTYDSDDDNNLEILHETSSNMHKITSAELREIEYNDEYPDIDGVDKFQENLAGADDSQDSVIRVYLEGLENTDNNKPYLSMPLPRDGDGEHDEDEDEIISVLNPFASENISQTYLPSSRTSSRVELELEPTDEPDEIESKLYGKTLRFFSNKSHIRKLCYRVLSWRFTNQFLTALLISQVSLLSYQQWQYDNGYFYAKKYTFIDWILFVYNVIYTVEMFMKIVAFGLHDDSQMIQALKLVRYENKLQNFYRRLYGKFKESKFYNDYSRLLRKKRTKSNGSENPFTDKAAITQEAKPKLPANADPRNRKSQIRYAYLRTDWNRVDFVSIISFWISFFLSFDYERMEKAKVFRALMCLRILRLLNINKGSRIVLRGLKESALQSKDVILFLICFWVLFAIIGVESFQSSLRRHCVWENPNDPSDTYLNAFQFCGSYLEPGTLKILPYLKADGKSSGITKGYACPVNSKCILGDNPYGGRVSFDNILESLQGVFVIISANTFSDLMYYTMDSDSMAASIFYIAAMFVLVVWLLNLFVAVIIHSYDVEERSRNEKESWYSKHAKIYNDFVANSRFVKYLKKVDVLFVLLILSWFIFSCTKKRVDGEFSKKYQTGDFIVSIILLAEIVIRFGVFLLEGNCKVFFYSLSNDVDLFLGIMSFIFSLPVVYNLFDSISNGYLSVFGILRFYRVVVSVKPVRKAWELAFKKTRPFAELILFGALLLYLVSIIMSRLFEGVVPESEMDENPWIMYNLPNSIVSLFIITTTENWTDILYINEQYASLFDSICIGIFLIAWFILSNTVIISIFIAIITDNLKIPDSEKKIIQIKHFIKGCVDKTRMNNEGLFDLVRNKFNRNAALDEANHFIARMNEILVNNGHNPIDIEEYSDQDRPMRRKVKSWKRKIRNFMDSDDQMAIIRSTYHSIKAFCLKPYHKHVLKLEEHVNSDGDNLTSGSPPESSDSQADPFTTETPTEEERLLKYEYNQKKKRNSEVDRSLLVFTNENPIRRFCQVFVSPTIPRKEGRHPAPRIMYCFNVFVFLASVALVVLACYETPLYRRTNSRGESYSLWMMYPDVTFMIIFTIEFLMKIIADGLIMGDRSYFKSIWNILDFIVLISLWVTVLSVVNDDYTVIVSFNALKAFRAFRLLTITNESQMIFHFAIISGIYKIFSAALVSLSLLVPFALWGLNLFNKELSYCADGISTMGNCTLEFSNEVFKWKVLSPNYVETPYLEFDSFGSSIQTLFEILSLEGWVDLLGNVMNIDGYGQQPSAFASPGNGVFVIIFIFCAVVFILNLFISIIINNYTLQTGIAYLSNEQYGWYEVKKVLSKVKPSRRRDEGDMSYTQKKVFDFINEKRGIWSKFITLVLFIHFMVLLSESYPDTTYGPIIRNAFYLCTTFVLLLHMLLILYAVGLRVFLSNKMNATMSAILLAAVIMSAISIKRTAHDAFYNIYKVFVVTVLCLVIPQVDELNQLIKYGSTGLFSLIALLYTWLVLFLVFAIALNQIFGLTRFGPNTTGNLNARTVTKALIMLFRNSFGEGWNYIAQDFTVEKPYCYSGPFGDSDCGNDKIALCLFFIWNISSMYIFLNILISVVINNFSYVYHGSGPHKLITRDEIRKFKLSWNKFDPTGSGHIYEKDLFRFLHSLDGVLSYHVYPKYLSLPAISRKVLSEKNPTNGYDFQVNTTRLREIFAMIDFAQIRQRRMRYDRLVAELLDSSVVINTDTLDNETRYIRKIPFKEAILVIGYYSRFEDSTCLTLEDFLRHSTQMRMIIRELRKAKVLSTIKMIFTRLRYRYYVDKVGILDKIRNASNASERERISDDFRRKLKGVDVSFDILMDSLQDEEEVVEDNPIFNDNLYRVMSQSSQNPFSDVYNTNRRGSFESYISDGIPFK